MAKAKKAAKKNEISTPVVVPQATSSKKGGLLAAILAVFVIFSVAEIYFVAQKSVRESKRPSAIVSFPNQFTKGLTSFGEYGNFLYGMNGQIGMIYKVNKTSGALDKIFEIKEMVSSVVADSKGNMYILDKKGNIQIYTPDNRPKGKIAVEGMRVPCWMEIDSKDNFYIVDCETSMINKYDSAFKKIASFGGRGGDRGNFVNVGKIYAGPNDDIYCINMIKENTAHIKIFNSNGKFIKEWPVKKMIKFGGQENLAITSNGNVYINSFEGSKIYVYNNDGRLMSNFDTDIKKTFLITYPSSITGGKDGKLYVATHDMGVFDPIVY